MSARAGRIELNMSLVRMLLDLPEGMSVCAVVQSDEDKAMNVCQVIVASAFCPEWTDGALPPLLTLHYREVGCCVSELDRIDGLDT